MYDASPASPGSRRGDLNILATCPSCRASYHPLQTRIVAERDDEHLLFLECRQCGSGVVALVTTGVSGVSSVGTLTDLTSSEVGHLALEHTITTDDVLDFHVFINSDSTVSSILRREKDSR